MKLQIHCNVNKLVKTPETRKTRSCSVAILLFFVNAFTLGLIIDITSAPTAQDVNQWHRNNRSRKSEWLGPVRR